MFSQRQDIIINTLILEGSSSIRDLLSKINIGNKDVSKVTILRDIDKLIKSGYVNRTGIGRSIRYNVGLKGKFLSPVSIFISSFLSLIPLQQALFYLHPLYNEASNQNGNLLH